MRALPVLVRSGAIVVVVSGLSGCFRERVRLGDGPLDASMVDTSVDAGARTLSSEGSSTDHGSRESTIDRPGTTAGETTSSVVTVESSQAASTGVEPESDSTTTTADAGNVCVGGQVSGNEVLWIGDSWLLIPGNQETGVEARAREAGVLGADESYINRARAAHYLADIVGQYEAQKQAGPSPKVVIMNGGTWDTIQADALEESVSRVVAEFEEFLTLVADDGTVQHLVYMLNPELQQIPGVAELRPGLVEVCSKSVVPCHFLDLQPLWAGHAEYTDGTGIQASVAGAEVIAQHIWAIMQDECIAQ